MSIKSTIETVRKIAPTTYPCFKKAISKDPFIVMFTSRTKGTVVWTSKDAYWELGHYTDSWVSADNPNEWETFDGKIVLEC